MKYQTHHSYENYDRRTAPGHEPSEDVDASAWPSENERTETWRSGAQLIQEEDYRAPIPDGPSWRAIGLFLLTTLVFGGLGTVSALLRSFPSDIVWCYGLAGALAGGSLGVASIGWNYRKQWMPMTYPDRTFCLVVAILAATAIIVSHFFIAVGPAARFPGARESQGIHAR